MLRAFTVGALLALLGVQQASAQVVEYMHTDALGTPVVLTDSQGAVIDRSTYRPYGLPITGGPRDRPGFTGHVEDASTGLDYMQQRYYDPSLGVFLSADPVTADRGGARLFHRYAYAFNNPYTFTDPDGRCPDKNPCIEATPFNVFRDTFSGRMWSSTVGDTIALTRSDSYNPLSNEYRSQGQLQDAKFNLLLAAMPVARVEGAVAQESKVLLQEARTARDALASALSPLGGKAPATVTAGYNRVSGEVAASACGGGVCAETNVVTMLGGKASDVQFTEAVRPRTMQEVPICARCESTYGRESFPPETKFQNDR